MAGTTTMVASPQLTVVKEGRISHEGSPNFVLLASSARTPPQKLSPTLPRLQGTSAVKPSPVLAAVFSQQAYQQAVAVAAAEEDDLFELPPPVVDLDDEELANGESLGGARIADSEDGSDFGDVDPDAAAQDDSLVRTPCGRNWVKASKTYALDRDYTIWFQHAQFAKKKAKSQEQYEDGLQSIGTFNSVQDFWRYWNAIDLKKMQNFCTLSVFKHPIKPMWEDPHNKEGGQWIIRCADRAQTADFFSKLALALIGGYFECHEDLCGVVLSMKPKFNSLSVWNCQVERELIEPVTRELRELLCLDQDDARIEIEYKDHGGAMFSNAVKRHQVPEAVAFAEVASSLTSITQVTSLTGAGSRLAPSWAVRPARVISTTTSAPVAVATSEAQPAARIITDAKTETGASSSSGLKATAAPFTMNASAHGFTASSTADYQYTQGTASNGNTYANYYSSDYGYYGTGEYPSTGTTYYPVDQNAGNEWG